MQAAKQKKLFLVAMFMLSIMPVAAHARVGQQRILAETRIGGIAPESANAIGHASPVSSTQRWGCWQIYDRTPVGSLVGLDYFGARYMSSAQGRFTSPDAQFADQHTVDPQSWNLYGYGRNNPLRYTDPTGRCVVDGETHNWLWCAAHSIGLTQTVKEQADAARAALSQMHGFTIGGQSPAEIAKSGTNPQVIAAGRAATEFLVGRALESLAPCGGRTDIQCGVAFPMVGGRPVFRGGTSLAARPGIDVKVGTDGLVRPGRGISVSLDPKGLERFGGARQVASMPEELELVQRGANANHYEIAPKVPMTLQRFQELLKQVVLKE